jgi:hypothetical protein
MAVGKACLAAAVAAHVAALIGPAGAQTKAQGEPLHPPMIVYLQVSDARFDSYLYVKRTISTDHNPESADDFFYIPRATSKERERELANWRRKFRLIVSAATLSERVQQKIAQVKEEFERANIAVECATVDKSKERQITITVIGSSSETAAKHEYEVASREFFSDPKDFRCKYKHGPVPSTSGP